MSVLSLYMLASALSEPLWRRSLRRRIRSGKEDAARQGERLATALPPRPAGALLWVHALGLGEAGAMLALIRAVQAARPGLTVLLTTNTRTGAEGLARLGLPPGVLHQYLPVDAPGPVTRFLDHWRPDAFVLAELDLWPRLLVTLSRRGVPMAMVNARLTDHRFAGRRKLRALFAPLLRLFRAILVQDAQTAARMAALGADPLAVRVAGLLKAAAAPLPDLPDDRAAFARAIGDRPVWLAASTEGREHAALIAAHAAARKDRPDLLLILAPRQLTDADAAAEAAAQVFGHPPPRRSTGALPMAGDAVFLADSVGEMGLWHRLAPVTFVGHSLDLPGDRPLTGKNPFEAALLGSAVLHGPCTGNFAESYDALAAAGGATAVADATALTGAVLRLSGDAQARAAQVAAARRVVDQASAALPETVSAVLGLLTASGREVAL